MEDLNYTVLFDTAAAARKAIDALVKAGVSMDDIAVATRYPGTETVFGTASSVLPGRGPYSWGPWADLEPRTAVGYSPVAFVNAVPDGEVASIFEGLGLTLSQARFCADALGRGGAVLHIDLPQGANPAQPVDDVLRSCGARFFTTADTTDDED